MSRCCENDPTNATRLRLILPDAPKTNGDKAVEALRAMYRERLARRAERRQHALDAATGIVVGLGLSALLYVSIFLVYVALRQT